MPFPRRRFARRSFRRGFATNKKWIGFHTVFPTAATNIDPLSPQSLSTGAQFAQLVSPEDYGATDAASTASTTERQERCRVLRSIGHLSVLTTTLATGNTLADQVLAIKDIWFYFAALNADDVANAVALDLATGPGTGTDQYSLGTSPPPGLWRQPVKKFGYEMSLMTAAQDVNATTGYHVLTNTSMQRTWDFRPRARMQVPEAWYLVWGVELFLVQPVPPPEAFGVNLYIGTRTLITD